MSKVKITKNIDVIIKVNCKKYFSTSFILFSPYLFTKQAKRKNLKPLDKIEQIIKRKKLKYKKPLPRVKILQGIGVNPAIKIIAQPWLANKSLR